MLDDAELGGLEPEHDVLGDGQRLHQHEVLVHHADAQVDRLARALDVDHRAVDDDLTRVGAEQPVRDVHQRRLSGAVLAEKRDDLAAVNVERDVVDGENSRKTLGDVGQSA